MTTMRGGFQSASLLIGHTLAEFVRRSSALVAGSDFQVGCQCWVQTKPIYPPATACRIWDRRQAPALKRKVRSNACLLPLALGLF